MDQLHYVSLLGLCYRNEKEVFVDKRAHGAVKADIRRDEKKRAGEARSSAGRSEHRKWKGEPARFPFSDLTLFLRQVTTIITKHTMLSSVILICLLTLPFAPVSKVELKGIQAPLC